MAEIAGKNRQEPLHIRPLTIPGGQAVDREAVTEIVQARDLSPACLAMDSCDTPQRVERFLNGAAGEPRAVPVREKEGSLTLRKPAPRRRGI